MQTLPLFLEIEGIRVVHACWDDHHIATLQQYSDDGTLSGDLIYNAAEKAHPLYLAVETTKKGPEYPPPAGSGFHDKDGVRRDYIRLKWWVSDPQSWHDVAMSVPEPGELPTDALPEGVVERNYPTSSGSVFF